MYTKEQIKFFSLLATDPNVDIKPLTQRLMVAYPKLVKWKKEFIALKEAGELQDLLDKVPIELKALIKQEEKTLEAFVDDNPELIISKHIAKVKQYVTSPSTDLKLPEFCVDEATGKITDSEYLKLAEDQKKIMLNQIKDVSTKFRDSITGLQVLKTELQAAAGTMTSVLLKKIMFLDGVTDSTKELQAITKCLSDLQTAFFNQNTTQIQVNNLQGSDSLTQFRKQLKN